jgi:hypothetical protein
MKTDEIETKINPHWDELDDDIDKRAGLSGPRPCGSLPGS